MWVVGPVLLLQLHARYIILGAFPFRKLLRESQWQQFALPCTQVPLVTRHLQSKFLATPRLLRKHATLLPTASMPPRILPPYGKSLHLSETQGRKESLLLPWTLTNGKLLDADLWMLLSPENAVRNRPERMLETWSPKLKDIARITPLTEQSEPVKVTEPPDRWVADECELLLTDEVPARPYFRPRAQPHSRVSPRLSPTP